MISTIKHLLNPLQRRVALMVSRAVVVLVNDALKMQGVQINLLAGVTRDGVERFQNYGFTSNPHPGAEAIVVSVGGNQDHGIAIVVDDRRYRLVGLAEGEAALYDDLGQKVHLTRNGIVIRSTMPITLDAPTVHAMGNLNVDGSIVAQLDISDHGNKSMAAMRAAYNSHAHTDPQGGSVGTPSASM